MNNIKSWTRASMTELASNVEDGHQWNKLVHTRPTVVSRTAKDDHDDIALR